MRSYITKRVLSATLTLVAISSVMFLLFRLIPGDPTTIFLGTGQLSAADMQALREAWGLDEPLWRQYATYVANVLTGDFGTSFRFHRPVSEVILPMLANTLLIMAPAVLLAMLIGIGVGSMLGWRRGTRMENVGSLLGLLPASIPVFWTGILALMLFGYWLKWFPLGGIRTPGFFPEQWFERVPGFDVAHHMVLPVVVAVTYFISDPLMIMRTSMIRERSEDYITYARAAGFSDGSLRRIARRTAILPVLTYAAIMVSFALGGQVLLEVVFSWPGMGRLMVESVSYRDYPVAQACFLMMAAIVIFLNLLVDIAYPFMDPRIRPWSHAG